MHVRRIHVGIVRVRLTHQVVRAITKGGGVSTGSMPLTPVANISNKMAVIPPFVSI